MARKHSLKKIFDRDGGKCRYCGTPVRILPQRRGYVCDMATVDHVVPKARGGTSGLANLVLACRDCNKAKGDGPAIKPPRPTVRTPDFDSGNGGSNPPEAAKAGAR